MLAPGPALTNCTRRSALRRSGADAQQVRLPLCSVGTPGGCGRAPSPSSTDPLQLPSPLSRGAPPAAACSGGCSTCRPTPCGRRNTEPSDRGAPRPLPGHSAHRRTLGHALPGQAGRAVAAAAAAAAGVSQEELADPPPLVLVHHHRGGLQERGGAFLGLAQLELA